LIVICIGRIHPFAVQCIAKFAPHNRVSIPRVPDKLQDGFRARRYFMGRIEMRHGTWVIKNLRNKSIIERLGLWSLNGREKTHWFQAVRKTFTHPRRIHIRLHVDTPTVTIENSPTIDSKPPNPNSARRERDTTTSIYYMLHSRVFHRQFNMNIDDELL
jgi:hypothetical protein